MIGMWSPKELVQQSCNFTKFEHLHKFFIVIEFQSQISKTPTTPKMEFFVTIAEPYLGFECNFRFLQMPYLGVRWQSRPEAPSQFL